MKKLLIGALCFNALVAMAQTPKKESPKAVKLSRCAAIQKLVALATADDLYDLAGDNFTSHYYNTLFGAELFASTTNLPDVKESFVELDRGEGASYHAVIKDYGKDEAAAKKELAALSKIYAACLPDGKLKAKDDTTTVITLTKAKIELHSYFNSISGSWVAMLLLEHL